MYIKRVKNLEENSKIGKEIISSLQDAILQEAKKKKQKSALSPFCYLGREEKKKEPQIIKDAGNVEQGIEFFNSTFSGGTKSNMGVESSVIGESSSFTNHKSLLNEESIIRGNKHPITAYKTFIESKEFTKQCEKLKLTVDDVEEIKDKILSGVTKAQIGDSLYKFEFSPSSHNKAKTSAFRVIYIYIDEDDNVWLMSVYSKNEKSDISKQEKDYYNLIVEQIKKSIRERGSK